MASAHQIRDLIAQTTTGTARPRVPRGGALLLADRVGEAVQGRAARLSTRSHAASCPEPGHGHPGARTQVVGILREYRD